MKVLFIIAWIACSVAVAVLAERKGRSFELFLNVALVLSPVVGLIAVLVAKPTQKALLDMGRARRCRHCDHLMAADVQVCPVCRGRQPKGRIKTDREVTTWVMLGGWAGTVLLGFGLLTLIGLGVEWARRSAF